MKLPGGGLARDKLMNSNTNINKRDKFAPQAVDAGRNTTQQATSSNRIYVTYSEASAKKKIEDRHYNGALSLQVVSWRRSWREELI